MCDSRCWNASSPPSACHCSCGGRNHGRGRGWSGYGHAGYRTRYQSHQGHQPKFIFPAPKPLSFVDYVKDIGKSVLTNALLYGFSAAFPLLGAVAIPTYTAHNYLKLGQSLYEVCNELISKGKVSGDSAVEASGALGESVTQPSADDIASTIVSKARHRGLFEEMTKATHVDEPVFAEMLKGSASSALSTSEGELAKFVIRKMVGA